MSEPIEVEATVIDTDLDKLSGLDKFLAEVRETIGKMSGEYMVYDIDTYDRHKEADRDIKAMNATLKEIDAVRLSKTRVLDSMKRQVMDAVRDATKDLTEKRDALKARDEQFKADQVAQKMSNLRQTYQEAAPDLAGITYDSDGNPTYGKPLVEFDKLVEVFGQGSLGKKWENWGTSEKVAEDQLFKALTKIADDEDTIESTVAEEDREDVKLVYFSTLDLSSAMTKARELKDQRDAMRKLEQERRERLATEQQLRIEVQDAVTEEDLREAFEHKRQYVQELERAASEPNQDESRGANLAREHYVENAAQPMPGDEVPEMVFFAYCTKTQLSGIVAYCKAHGIHGSARATHGKRHRLVIDESLVGR